MSRDSFDYAAVERLLMAASPFAAAFTNHKYGRGVSAKNWRDLHRAVRGLATPSAKNITEYSDPAP